MLRILARKIRDSLRPPKRQLSDIDGPLSDDEKETVYALFEAVTAHPNFDAHGFLAFLNERTDLHGEMRAAAALLDGAAARRFKGLPFYQLTSDARQTVLESLLKKYPYRSNESSLRNRLGLTSKNLEVLTVGRNIRALREYVIRELLAFYYEGEEGWAVVGYDKARGHAIEERGDGEVIGLLEQHGRLLLELSDGTFEEFAERNLIAGEPGMIRSKGGRQKARLSQSVEADLAARRISTPPRSTASV